MKDSTKEKLQKFVTDTWSSNHPADDLRFCDFIIEAYNNGDYSMSSDEFLSFFGVLNSELENKAMKKFNFYIDGVVLLRRFECGL